MQITDADASRNPIRKLTKRDIPAVIRLFCDCFQDDTYYKDVLHVTPDEMADTFRNSISGCILLGNSYGYFRTEGDNETLLGFFICFYYKDVEKNHKELFHEIFYGRQSVERLPQVQELTGQIDAIIAQAHPDASFLYGLSIAVDPLSRKEGIGTKLFDHVIDVLPHQHFICDVSSPISKKMCEERGFTFCDLTSVTGDVTSQETAPVYGLMHRKKTETSVTPDVFFFVPVQYDPGNEALKLLREKKREEHHANDNTIAEEVLQNEAEDRANDNAIVKQVIDLLDHHTGYEAGIASWEQGKDQISYNDQSGLQERIERIALGSVEIQISRAQFDASEQEEVLGTAEVEPFVSIDNKSRCGVFTWFSLASALPISQYLDSVIRNSLKVISDGRETGLKKNIFDHISEHFGLKKVGSPKAFVMIPEDESCLDGYQKASILASEEIFDQGETFGRVIDPRITEQFRHKGLGQYERGVVYAFSNVVLHFLPDMKQITDHDRIQEEKATLYYIEMTQFEEAAIGIANRAISGLLGRDDDMAPIRFLEEVDAIQSQFSKTIDFWDIQVNYPTSQLSIDMIRDRFMLQHKRDTLKRNQEQLQLIYDIKSDKNDRANDRRVNSALAIISLLAIFSAWVDGMSFVNQSAPGFFKSFYDFFTTGTTDHPWRLVVGGLLLICTVTALIKLLWIPFFHWIRKRLKKH